MTKQFVLFAGVGSNGRIDLWESDGTAAGTVPILPADTYSGSLGSGGGGLLGDISGSPTQPDFTQFGSIALFTGIDAQGAVGLWRTDGTAAGTYEITVNGAPSYGITYPWNTGYAVLGDTVYFAGDGSGGTNLWSTQGTTASTVPVAVPEALSGNLAPANFITFDNGTKLLFTGQANAGSGQGTPQEYLIDQAGISAVAMPNQATIAAAAAAALGNDVVFFNQNEARFPAFAAGADIGSGYATDGLWTTDGTAAGTQPLVGLPAISVDGMTALGSVALFRGTVTTPQGTTADLWITDGTAAGTAPILPAGANAAGLLSGVTPNFVRLGNGQILFEGNDSAGVLGLWITDGTSAGTHEISVAGANAAGLFASSGTYVAQPQFAVINGIALFYGLDAAGRVGLWSSDGTSAGTTELAVAGANANGIAPSDLTTVTLCFATGTRIATPMGEVPVEALRPGDPVLTVGGARLAPRTIRWAGHFSVDLARHPAPARAAPVRIRAHAFAPGVPRRDVLLSPDHGVLFRGALFPARLLIDGATVVQAFPRRITYHHVELDRHAVLLAEGLPAESYLDLGTRGRFDGEPGTRPLFPDLAAAKWDALACAPLVLAGPRLKAARAHLAARAAAGQSHGRRRSLSR
jgi:ELWxxDGT repeat protein